MVVFTSVVCSSRSYLLNPFTILSCVAKSTCALNNAVIALFFLSTIKGQMSFPIQASHHKTHTRRHVTAKMKTPEQLTGLWVCVQETCC